MSCSARARQFLQNEVAKNASAVGLYPLRADVVSVKAEQGLRPEAEVPAPAMIHSGDVLEGRATPSRA